jgi:hypothetical protein
MADADKNRLAIEVTTGLDKFNPMTMRNIV